MIRTDVKFQVADQRTQCSDVADILVTAVLGSVALCLLQTLKTYGVVNSQQSPRFIFYVVIYFRINILVYFCLISVCFALLTTMRV